MVREDIERSARSMYNSLKLERELQDQGIPLFATDEPFNIEGINATGPRQTRQDRRIRARPGHRTGNPRRRPADPAAQALRNRVRARFTELYTERTGIETELATLETATVEEDDPTLLDELSTLGDILTDAPAALTERLLAAFDIKATYNRDKHQVTIHATDATPQAVTDLVTDPRADHNKQPAPPPASAPAPQDHVAHLTGDTGSPPGPAQRSGGFRGRPPGPAQRYRRLLLRPRDEFPRPRFSRSRMDTLSGLPSKPNSSRSLRSTNRR